MRDPKRVRMRASRKATTRAHQVPAGHALEIRTGPVRASVIGRHLKAGPLPEFSSLPVSRKEPAFS